MRLRAATVVGSTIWLALITVAGVQAQAPTYTIAPLLGFSGGEAHALNLNNDGYVVGATLPETAAMWQTGATAATGLIGLVGESSSSAAGVNNNGFAVGYSSVGGASYVVRWDLNHLSDPGTSLGLGSGAAINNSGQIAGTYDAGGTLQATLWSGGSRIALGVAGGANDINSGGRVAGFDSGHATLWDTSGGSITAIDLDPSGDDSAATAVNDGGAAVGYAYSLDDDRYHATLWEPAGGGFNAIDLDGTDGISSEAYDINANGWIIGSLETTSGTHSTLWIGGVAYNLDDFASGWSDTHVTGINDAGDIVGWGMHDGQSSGFIMNLDTPDAGVPEPCSLALLPMALGGLAVWRRRKKA